MKYVLTILSLFFCCFVFDGCFLDEHRDFYHDLAGWDWIVVPIIKPFKVSSTDHGENWYLEMDTTRGALPVLAFGVSQNLIFGQGTEGWFLFDTRSRMLAEYASREELEKSMQSLQIPIRPMSTCSVYHDSLSNGKRCYWYPPDGEKYPVYPPLSGPDTANIWVSGSLRDQPALRFDAVLRPHPNKIYFFKVHYDEKKNDRCYLFFGFSQPVLISDGMLIPAFAAKKELPVSVSKDRRIWITDSVSLRP